MSAVADVGARSPPRWGGHDAEGTMNTGDLVAVVRGHARQPRRDKEVRDLASEDGQSRSCPCSGHRHPDGRRREANDDDDEEQGTPAGGQKRWLEGR